MTKRWSETQHLAAAWLAARGWPYAEPVGNGRGGTDITGTPDLAVEVKAEDGWRPTGWLRQATGQRGCADVAFVIQRPKGFGPATIASWPVIIRLDEFTELLKAAGYGDASDHRGDRTVD